MCYYKFEEFRLACSKEPPIVIISVLAEEGARENFELTPKEKVLRFIYNKGLEELKFLRTEKRKNNKNPHIVQYIDSYEFRSSSKLGYLAFFKSTVNNKTIWIIKSFKLSNNNSPLALALIKAGIPDMIKE